MLREGWDVTKDESMGFVLLDVYRSRNHTYFSARPGTPPTHVPYDQGRVLLRVAARDPRRQWSMSSTIVDSLYCVVFSVEATGW